LAPNLTGPSPVPASIANAGPCGTITVFDGVAPGGVADALTAAEEASTVGELSGLDFDLHADAPSSEAPNANPANRTEVNLKNLDDNLEA
jgi:hypothetical protein